ncbi:MAG: hypothetical protein KBD14_00555 [Candidatus Pacebacteria bacterium]|nr:hypothetical protein [Candidatus Paceibacterota bacterium]
MKNFFQKGITAVETLIVIAIIVLIVSIVMPRFADMRNVQILQNSTLDVFNALNKARSNTLAGLNSQSYGVHFSTNQVIIFEGTVYDSSSASNEVINLDSRSSISTISLSGGGSDIYFNRIYGKPNKTGTLTISVGSFTKNVYIGSLGNISLD